MCIFCLWLFLIFSLCLWCSFSTMSKKKYVFILLTKDILISVSLYWIEDNFFKYISSSQVCYSAVYSTNWVLISIIIFLHQDSLFLFKIWSFFHNVLFWHAFLYLFSNFKTAQHIGVFRLYLYFGGTITYISSTSFIIIGIVSPVIYFRCCCCCEHIFRYFSFLLWRFSNKGTAPSKFTPPQSIHPMTGYHRVTKAWTTSFNLINSEVLFQPLFQLHYVSTSLSVQSCFPRYLINVISESTSLYPCKHIPRWKVSFLGNLP